MGSPRLMSTVTAVIYALAGVTRVAGPPGLIFASFFGLDRMAGRISTGGWRSP